jgi:hypothetical protein
VLSLSILPVSTACTVQSQEQVKPEVKVKPEAKVNPEAKVAVDFTQRIDKYVEMRKQADDGVPKQKETEDPARIKLAQEALAQRIMAARAGAKHGDIFTPEIAARFRRLLRPEVKDTDTKKLILDDNPGNIPFKVNGPYPDKEPLSTVPPNVLASLPQLPEEIEYRFVGKHLILRDARANLVIDYIANVIA